MIKSFLTLLLLTGGLVAQSLTVQPSLINFGNVPVGQNSTLSYSVYGVDLVDTIIISAPAPFQISTSMGTGFGSQVLLPPSGDTTTIYIRFTPAIVDVFDKNINHESGEASNVMVRVLATSFAVQPTTPPSNLVFTNIDSTSMTLGWSPGNGNERVVLMRAGSVINASPSDGQSYSANSLFGSGDVIGSGNNYVVYNGSGTSVTVTGLQKQQTYAVAIYEFNGTGGSENYLSDSLGGAQITRGRPPVKTSLIPDTTAMEDFGTVFFGGNLNGYFYDSDSPLTFSVSSPPGLSASIVGNFLRLTSVNDSNGAYQVIVTASDEFPQSVSDTFTVTLQPQNDAPRLAVPIPNGAINEDAGRVFISRLTSVFTDPDGDPLTFGASTSDPQRLSAVVSNDSLYLQTVKDSNGVVDVYVLAQDPSLAERRDTFTVTINPVSDPPYLAAMLRDTTLIEDFGRAGIARLTDFFKDIEHDTFEYNYYLLSPGVIPEFVGDSLYLNSIGNFFGTASIIITAFDGLSSVEDTMDVIITNVNDAPRSLAFIQHLDLPEDAGKVAVARTTEIITDDDGDVLSFSVSSSDTLVLRTLLSGDTLYLITLPDVSGSATVFLTAIDPSMAVGYDTFTVNITPVSDPPFVVNAMRDTILSQDFPRTFVRLLSQVFSDIDDTSLVYAAMAINAGIAPEVRNDSLYLKSLPGFSGQVNIRVTASDGESTVADTFLVSVRDLTVPSVFVNALATPATDVIRFVVGSNESLSLLSVTVNSVNLQMSFQKGIYFGDYRLTQPGPLTVIVSAKDFAGNLDTLKREYQVGQLNKGTSFAGLQFTGTTPGFILLRSPTIPQMESVVPLGIPFEVIGAVSGQINVSATIDNLVQLTGDPDADLRKAALYERINEEWAPVSGSSSSLIFNTRILRSGVYQVYYDRNRVVVPDRAVLRQNYPNPFNPSTTIEFEIVKESRVQVMVYNLLGQRVKKLEDGVRKAGVHSVVWNGTGDDGRHVASGVYIYRIQAGDFVESKKMILTK